MTQHTNASALCVQAETDILAEAANAQFRASDFMGTGVLRACAPAKVNLFLGVQARRADGYHDVTTVLHALALHDTVYVNVTPLAAADQDAVQSNPQKYAAFADGQGVVSVEMVMKGGAFAGVAPVQVNAADNLAFKAVSALAQTVSTGAGQHIRVRIEKHIPAAAGLGGGSSNAAAVLTCLSQFWDVSPEVVEGVAQGLGADVAFFLRGGCALFSGVGEVFERALQPVRTPLVVIKPAGGVATAAAYATFDECPVAVPDSVRAAAAKATAADEVPLFNNLTAAAERVQPEVTAAFAWLLSCEGVRPDQTLLSGSGSAVFAQVDSFSTASRIAAAAKLHGYWARATSFANLRAQVIS